MAKVGSGLSGPSRRSVLTVGGGVVLWALTAGPARAAAERVLAGRTPRADGLTLSLPPVADNPSSVALTVAADSPMTAEDHVTALHVIAPANPEQLVATARFTPAAGRAETTLRIRLADSQEIQALAEFSDGSVALVAAAIETVEGGCAAFASGS